MHGSERTYDCIILGSGLGGAMLGAILARHQKSVLLIDAGTHPRFAVGEATTPDTSFRLKLLAHKFDVPEIYNLSTFHHLRDHVSPACGVKRAFSFLYQREGREQDPLESHQYPTLAPPMGPDCHLFRQDTDAYMMAVAVGYGAVSRQEVRATGVELNDDGVVLTTQRGETFRGRYLVDAAGFRSPIADKLGLRDDPDTLRTNSRTIFTHMTGVKLYDAVGAPHKSYGLKYPLSQSTLHHVFTGGWFWIIPFNNHHDAVNPLCSVGVVLNRELHPETGMDAEEEFYHYVHKFPSMERQFAGARAVRNWVSTGRLQYCSKELAGPRCSLLAHAAGFIDPLFSSGLNLTAGHVDLLAKALLAAFADDDFAPARFAPVHQFFQTSLRRYDEVVGSSFVAFRDCDLWDAWFRVWVVALLLGTELNADLYMRFLESGDLKVLADSEKSPYTGVLGSEVEEYRRMYDQALAEMDRVRDGLAAPREAAARIRGLMRSLTFVPDYFQWHDPRVRSTPAFTVWGVSKMYLWYFLHTPRALRKQLFGWSPFTAYRFIWKSIRHSSVEARRRRRQYVRDVFRAWNDDWTVDLDGKPAAPAPETVPAFGGTKAEVVP